MSGLPAQETTALVFTWEPVQGAGAYLVELRRPGGKVEQKIEVKEAAVQVQVIPGTWEIRISTINRFGEKEGSSDWKVLNVVRKKVPQVQSITASQATSGQEITFVIEGTNFYSDTDVWIEFGGKRYLARRTQVLDGTTIKVWVSAITGNGAVDVVVSNGSDKTLRKKLHLPCRIPPHRLRYQPSPPSARRHSRCPNPGSPPFAGKLWRSLSPGRLGRDLHPGTGSR